MPNTNTSGQKAAATRGPRAAASRHQPAASTRGQRPAATRQRNASTATRAESAVRVNQAQQIAERAVLVPMGAGLLARDSFVATVKGLAGRYRTRTAVERELQRYERRGVTARNHFERQVHHTRTRFERELRERRGRVEQLVTDAQDRLSAIS